MTELIVIVVNNLVRRWENLALWHNRVEREDREMAGFLWACTLVERVMLTVFYNIPL
jgi:hypothetical protein